jgi:hypothetical protein
MCAGIPRVRGCQKRTEMFNDKGSSGTYVWPEVVAPLAHTMGFVNDKPIELPPRMQIPQSVVDLAPVCYSFWREIEQLALARVSAQVIQQLLDDGRGLARRGSTCLDPTSNQRVHLHTVAKHTVAKSPQ